MVVNNPNNWHWTDKNCINWAREYFTERLTGLNSDQFKKNSSKYCEIKSVSTVEGDCEVSQRKGKVISLFDLKLILLIQGNVNDSKFEGSITVPEIAFDTEIDEYQFDVSIYKETSELNEVKPVIRESIVPQLREIFQKFGKDLLIANGNDIQVPDEQVKSQFTKSNQQDSLGSISSESKKDVATTSDSVAKSSKTTTSTGTTKINNTSKNIPIMSTGGANTATIHLEPSFNVPSFELFNTFIDKERIMIWSRSPIKEGDDNKSNGSQFFMVGDKFELFNGNICSEIVESKLGTKLVMKWRLKDWRENLWSTLNMEFHESQEYHETKIQITWTGIPVGEEDRVRGNFEEYYVRPMKLTFGFGVVL